MFSVFSALDDIMAYPKSFGKTRTAGRVGKVFENNQKCLIIEKCSRLSKTQQELDSVRLNKTQQDAARLSKTQEISPRPSKTQ